MIKRMRADRKKNNVALAGVSGLLVAFIFFLLVTNYFSQKNLHELTEQKITRETRSFSIKLAHVFDQCRFFLQEIEDPGIAKDRLQPDPWSAFSSRRKWFSENTTQNNPPLYDALVWVDANKESFLTIMAPSGRFMKPPDWHTYPFSDKTEIYAACDGENNIFAMVFIVPHILENGQNGHLLAWMNPEALFHEVSAMDMMDDQSLVIMARQGSYFYPERFPPLEISKFQTVEFDKSHNLRLYDGDGVGHDYLTVMTGMDQYPFSILNILPLSHMDHYFTPKRLFLVMGVFAVFILVLTAGAVQMNMRSKALEIRASEYHKKQKMIQHINEQLKNKIKTIEVIRQQLEKSEEKYKSIVNGIADGYFETDIKGNFLYFNDSFCSLVEQPCKALANVNFKTIVPENSSIKIQNEFNALFRSIDTTRLMEHHFFNRAGQLRVHELSISLMKDAQGNPRGFSGMVRDVTERNASSIALRESEERLNIIMYSINAGIVIIDPKNYTIVEANPAALKMIGAKKTALIGTPCHKFLCPDTDGKCPMAHGVAQMEDKDQVLSDIHGNSIHVLKTVRQIYYDGRTHLLESFIDISDLKIVQDQLKESIQTAETANRVKSEFLANMSHELRTPLNHVIGFSELLLDPDFGTLTNIQEEYIRDIHESSRYLLSLINDILDLSKIEAGKMELEVSTVAIKKLLENSLIMVREKSIKYGVKLIHHIEGIPETIVADERKLKQILYNLLSNSIKFTPDNGVITLSAGLLDPCEATPEKGRMLEISVSDTGIGIEPDDIDRVFNYFEQLENPAVKKHPGTGIGLALTKQMVELHNGMIWAESDGPGKGATFTFTLPVTGKEWS